MDTAAPMISSDKMASATFQLPAVFPSASVGSDRAGHTLHCGAGSDRMIQVNNGIKAFFRILTDLWDKAEEMILQVLCIASP